MSPILWRYVARLYVSFTLLAYAALVMLFLAADFGDRMKALGPPWVDVGELYAMKLLVAIYQLGPAALMLGAAAAVSTLRRRGELSAMFSLGARPWQLVAPITCVALAFSLALSAYDEFVASRASARADVLQTYRFHTWGDFRFFYTPQQWFRAGDALIRIGAAQGEVFSDVTVLTLDGEFRPRARVDAQAMREASPSTGSGRGTPGHWQLTQAEVRTFHDDETLEYALHPSYEVTLPGTTAANFRILPGRPEQMRLVDLLEQRIVRARAGLPTQGLGLAIHNRFAYPLAGVAGALLAVCLAIRLGRKGHLTTALVEGLLIAAAMWALLTVGKTLALSEHLPVAVAAWSPLAVLLMASAAIAKTYWQPHS